MMTLVAEGLTNAQIAKHLYLSENTVKTHLLHLYAETGAHNRAHLVTWGFASGVLDPETYR